MKLFKFRSLQSCTDLKRIIDIHKKGFFCNDILNFNDMNEGIFRTCDFPSIGLCEKTKYKICSFSGINALNNELMWGHYANAGKGIVIEIDVGQSDEVDAQEIIENIYQVRYSNQITIGNDRIYNDPIIDILTRKSLVWKNEDEFRYIKKTDNNKVKIGKISKIWFGTPYKKLANYDDFKIMSDPLKNYLNLKELLMRYCNKHEIFCSDYEFNF